MALPRAMQGPEAARLAAAQAEFNEKKWVWVPDDKEGYLSGWVISEDGEYGEVMMASGSETRRLPLYALSKMNPPKFDRVDDIADLTFLNEAGVVHNLRLRYGSGAIYTYSSLFLVAVNPYQSLPLYTDAIVQQYRNKRRDENPPHIFAVAERAWVNMGDERENQSILITGESGAGKTENTKKVIQYLAAIATDVHNSHTRSPSILSTSSSLHSSLPRSHSMQRKSMGGSQFTAKGRLGLLERQILQANPILEAFGNAQTQRNNNSSRFGKFIRINFAPDGSIAGANIDWYLLEKSRVVVRSEAERSFHVFYQIMHAEQELKDKLFLDGDVGDYEYLNKSRREVDGVDDREEWRQLKSALEVVGLTVAEQFNLFRIVAAIIHLGNISITATRADDALMPETAQAERVCRLLGIPLAEFLKAVLRPRVLAGREWVAQARTRQQALEELSALCKTLYEKSFGALVDRINRALDRPSSKSTFIGVLDIAGFEIFEVNAYEQLLINYTNERLQQFFNHHMFELEQEEYARESIEWEYFDFGLHLQPTIELIETSGNTIGILSCLDEECIMPKATDATFTQKLHQLWSGEVPYGEKPHPGREKYTPARFEQGFIIKHYAGDVEYRTDGWLEKNKDPLNDNLTRILAASEEPYVAGLFADYAEIAPSGFSGGFQTGKRRAVKKGAFRTVAQRHKEQLTSLMNQLKATQPHFVRCIVPNGNKKPGRIDIPLVLDQLRCNGVLEGIRIARLGYPNRMPFVEFRQRYEVLTPGIIPRGYMDGRKASLRIVDALELDKTLFRIGTSKIFFKAGVLAELEERRDALLFDIFSRFQAAARMMTSRRQMKKVLNRAIAIRTIQRNARVYGTLRDWPWWQLYTKVRPLLTATRNDEELRRKELELALIKERAEREQREKEALENLKIRLESEKRKVEEDLDAQKADNMRNLDVQGRLQEEVDELRELLQRREDLEKGMEEELFELRSQLSQMKFELSEAREIEEELHAQREDNVRSADAQARLQEELDRLRALIQTKASEETRLKEIERKKEGELLELRGQLSQLNRELAEARKIEEELVAQRADNLRNADAQTRLQEELDRMHALIQNKASEEARLKDVEKKKEGELLELRNQLSRLNRELTEARKAAAENLTNVKAELEVARRENTTLQHENQQLVESERSLQARLKEVDAALSEAVRMKRVFESELYVVKTKQTNAESKLVDTTKAKEMLERQLTSAQSKVDDYEEAVIQLEREKSNWVRQMDETRTQLGEEKAKRQQLEKHASSQKTEIIRLKDINVKLDRELNKALDNLKAREWEVKQLESRQNKTIVEHVHVLEEAKRVTDKQLAEAQAELQRNITYIRSLEKAKAKLTIEAEDLSREAESSTRARDKEVRQVEKALAQALREKTLAEERAAKAEQSLRHHNAKNGRNDRRSPHPGQGSQQRLEEELQEERDSHAADLAERDFAMSQTQIAYQTKLAELTAELQSQRDSMSRLREENRKLRSDYDELQLQYDDEVYNGGAWKKEKERLEAKISDITNAYESSTAARSEQQSQIVALHSQLRELRGILEDAEAERTMLQKARRALQSQLDSIKLENTDPDKMSAESRFQDLQLQKQDLERTLEEHQDRVMMAEERMRKAEIHAQECQIELGEIRVENSELDRKNANLEKQLKEFNVRIVDLETKAVANASRRKGEALRQHRTGDRPPSRGSADSERTRSRLEDEVKSYEVKIANMREAMADLSTKEGELQLALRKAKREAGDYKKQALSLEQEIERLRGRKDRPASAYNSPAGSPRKFAS